MKIQNLLVICASLALAACAGVAVAESIKAVSETVSGNAIQHKVLTPAQLQTLAKDLGALPQTPLPSSDNVLIAGIIAEGVAHKQATLTDASAVDSINNLLSDITKAHAPTPADGVAWSNLQDVVLGMQAEVNLLAQNPGLVAQ